MLFQLKNSNQTKQNIELAEQHDQEVELYIDQIHQLNIAAKNDAAKIIRLEKQCQDYEAELQMRISNSPSIKTQVIKITNESLHLIEKNANCEKTE